LLRTERMEQKYSRIFHMNEVRRSQFLCFPTDVDSRDISRCYVNRKPGVPNNHTSNNSTSAKQDPVRTFR
jgi:hypothetical protein